MSQFRTAGAATCIFIVSPLGILNGIQYTPAGPGRSTATDFYKHSKVRKTPRKGTSY